MTESRDHPDRHRVLPGSRWRTLPVAGHATNLITVLRVGQHSVTLVIEGGGKQRGTSHRAGKRYNVALDAFLRNHELVSQPPGYQPGHEHLPNRPKSDTVQDYFNRRRYVDAVVGQFEGENVRDLVSDSPVLPAPPPRPKRPDTTPEKEPTVSAPHTGPKAPVANPVLSAEQARVLMPQSGYTTGPAENTPPPTTRLPQPYPVSEPAPDLEHGAPPAPPVEAKEADPIEQFMEAGNALVAGIVAKMEAAQKTVDDLLSRLSVAQDGLARLTRQKERIEAAVMAAIASTGEAEAPTPEPEGEPEDLDTGPLPDQAPAKVGPGTNVALPAGTQRAWVMDRLVAQGSIHVGSVADDFSARFGVPREGAIKQISSILGYQMRVPAPHWPVPIRTGKGSYALPHQG